MNNWMILGPFDTRGHISGEFSAYTWRQFGDAADDVDLLASTDNRHFGGITWSTDTGASPFTWERCSLNLADVPALGSLLGQPAVWVAIRFHSNSSGSAEGVYVDDAQVRLSYEGAQGFATYLDDTFDTGADPSPTGGWMPFGFQNSMASTWYEAGGYRAYVTPDPTHYRVTGVLTGASQLLAESYMSPNRVVRAKYYVYRGGQPNMADLNQVPNFRLRLSQRFAVNSMLEVFHHSNDDPANNALASELRPSGDFSHPSCYRVDLDPIDVPYLFSNTATEGIARGFEAYALYPQETGYVAFTESVLGWYDREATTETVAPVKIYQPIGGGAGDLHAFTDPEVEAYKLVPSAEPGAFWARDDSYPRPGYSENGAGVELSTVGLPASSVGVCTRHLNPDAGTNNYYLRARVAPNEQYTVRWHLTSTQLTNRQCQIRLRSRAAKFAWSQKLEIGGAWGTGAASAYPLNANNSIAQQSLPGVGCLNPDQRSPGEAGGWYTLAMHSPLSADIRADAAPGTSLNSRMPLLSAEPGFGLSSPSRRDIIVGLDLIDSLSAGAGAPWEEGDLILDRVEIRRFPLIPD